MTGRAAGRFVKGKSGNPRGRPKGRQKPRRLADMASAQLERMLKETQDERLRYRILRALQQKPDAEPEHIVEEAAQDPEMLRRLQAIDDDATACAIQSACWMSASFGRPLEVLMAELEKLRAMPPDRQARVIAAAEARQAEGGHEAAQWPPLILAIMRRGAIGAPVDPLLRQLIGDKHQRDYLSARQWPGAGAGTDGAADEPAAQAATLRDPFAE